MVDLVSVLKRLFALPIQGMTRIHVIECVQEMRVPVSVKDFKYTLIWGECSTPCKRMKLINVLIK